MPLKALAEFLKMEAAGGIILVLAAAAALVVANSAFEPLYQQLLSIPVRIGAGTFEIAKPLRLWINDGLMAIFFFLVGLEIKREFLEGELSTREQALLPAIGAVGGMALPALIYVAINIGHPEHLNGWAIPSATDIAFALGVLALLGSRVPFSLKVLLTAIAILDDLGAIIIIAVFYTEDLSTTSLSFAFGALAVLAAMNLLGVRKLAPYLVVGAVLWTCVLKSGVHATLAGVALAMTIPLAEKNGSSLLKSCEHGLHTWVAFGVLPIFGFANAGVSFAGMTWASFLEPITLGIALGLFVGKQIGVFTFLWLAIRSGLARLPEGASWQQLYGIALLCGIGFTMSLFIGSLAWKHDDFYAAVRLGVLTGSIASAIAGATLLAWAGRRPVAVPAAG
ncbi:MAG TPA: Na+/H+ antiporter NhaA [Rhodospirillales bacterium]|nr:Na+/H+ antiporter NhaA [Rhodospirillales bacterium]